MEARTAGPLGEFVKARRLARGESLTDLAKRAGLSKSELSALENGKIGLPGADKRRRLAQALGVSHEAILVAAGELLPEEASRPTEERRYSPESGYDAVLEALDRMNEREATALARIAGQLISLREPETVAAPVESERVPALA